METSLNTIGFSHARRFKSYYVVWKQNVFYPDNNIVSNSLNRTMQYGNIKIKTNTMEDDIKFKSYYVVWKPGGLFSQEQTPYGV